ncbi:Hypothetical protein PSEBR_m1628 [Pseudomonas brassicacearum subsp. brassicacearum NFM421]|uniref:Uncharacterized protein n=1 Tax=Pseudomonas brassicacearum (strain NFM421) TaxID=994484 RepID=F2KMB5_PSEBN|nr:Hypothetical protein PSEBR_m1628 [Pseudomonas brassicacearum subsp. brassicacearum NFM421]
MGTSLLAMAIEHSTPLSTDTPLSRASPLPQGIYGDCAQYSQRNQTNLLTITPLLAA